MAECSAAAQCVASCFAIQSSLNNVVIVAVLNAGLLLSGRSATPLPFLKTLESSGWLLSGKQSSRMRILRFFSYFKKWLF